MLRCKGSRRYWLPALMLCMFMLNAQNHLQLKFLTCTEKENLFKPDSIRNDVNKDSVSVEQIKFYISGIELKKNGKPVFKEKKSFHLLDISDSAAVLMLKQTPADYDEICFQLGIDSLTNVSGAMGGDLDPTKGMFWTWQSGYINFKMEGRSSGLTTRNKEFQLHIGGYSGGDNALQKVSLRVKPSKKISIGFNVFQAIDQINLRQTASVMSPGPAAVKLAVIISKNFFVLTP